MYTHTHTSLDCPCLIWKDGGSTLREKPTRPEGIALSPALSTRLPELWCHKERSTHCLVPSSGDMAQRFCLGGEKEALEHLVFSSQRAAFF